MPVYIVRAPRQFLEQMDIQLIRYRSESRKTFQRKNTLRMNSKYFQRRHSKLLTDHVEPERPSKNKAASVEIPEGTVTTLEALDHVEFVEADGTVTTQ
ncbi:hypothetical protein BOTCAL_0080g00140 [Botryotinia calthae]|uniref:Uncharacterized protein n=1 Tax=Botryotinia calthae TaxID=38488 RepID=A0A4Y8D7Z2_9HELO|nr:hypothetical protein BOTCAL_0080g00140 [Botryotinia calthae]